MSYFAFLLQFLGIPIAILLFITFLDYWRGKRMPKSLSAYQTWQVLLGICLVAFIYTTPWDNYLVATRVWYYDPKLVTGIVFGYVPIEEYTFFIVQPVMTGLFFALLAHHLPSGKKEANNPRLRFITCLIAFLAWLIATIILILGFFYENFAPFIYISLTLSWALIPIMIQLAFGADIFARHRLKIFLGIAIPTLYLSWADSLAINSGTWTINPEKSLNLFLGTLPLEEALFFLITNTLVVVGMTLVLAEESQARAKSLLNVLQNLKPLGKNS